MRRILVLAAIAISCSARGDATPPVPGKVLTPQWLRELLANKGALGKLLDLSSGLVLLDESRDDPREHIHGEAWSARLCGDTLTLGWAKTEEELRVALGKSKTLVCQDRPGPPLCVFGTVRDAEMLTYLVFRPVADGTVRLDAILHLDALQDISDLFFITAQEMFVQLRMTSHRSTDCSGKRTTPSEKYKEFRPVFH
jgi:hypothetical protein